MKNYNSTILYTGGKTLLGLIIAVYLLLLMLFFFRYARAGDNITELPILGSIRIAYYIFPLVLLIAGFFLVRKYTLIIGVTFLLLGISYTASWKLFPIKDPIIGLPFPFVECPLVVSTTLVGILFLANGLIKHRHETISDSLVEKPTSIPAEPRNKLPRIDIGVIAILVAALSILDFILLVLTFIFGAKLSVSEFLSSYGVFYLLFWGLWPIINIVGFIIGLVGILLHNNKAVIGFVIEIFQLVILGAFWFFSIFAFI